MLILAIEACGLPASAALVCDGKTVAEVTVNNKLNHSVTLMPMIDYLFRITELDLSDVDYIAVSTGPGSFTGLRIGAGTAKGLAHGAGKRIVGVPSLDALACNIFNAGEIIAPVMDARRGQVYTCFYERRGDRLDRLTDYMTLDIDECVDRVLGFGKNAVFLGDGTLVYGEKILRASEKFSLAPLNNNMQRAASVGLAAMLDVSNAVTYNNLSLFYLRKPQAEREYEERRVCLP